MDLEIIKEKLNENGIQFKLVIEDENQILINCTHATIIIIRNYFSHCDDVFTDEVLNIDYVNDKYYEQTTVMNIVKELGYHYW